MQISFGIAGGGAVSLLGLLIGYFNTNPEHHPFKGSSALKNSYESLPSSWFLYFIVIYSKNNLVN